MDDKMKREYQVKILNSIEQKKNEMLKKYMDEFYNQFYKAHDKENFVYHPNQEFQKINEWIIKNESNKVKAEANTRLKEDILWKIGDVDNKVVHKYAYELALARNETFHYEMYYKNLSEMIVKNFDMLSKEKGLLEKVLKIEYNSPGCLKKCIDLEKKAPGSLKKIMELEVNYPGILEEKIKKYNMNEEKRNLKNFSEERADFLNKIRIDSQELKRRMIEKEKEQKEKIVENDYDYFDFKDR